MTSGVSYGCCVEISAKVGSCSQVRAWCSSHPTSILIALCSVYDSDGEFSDRGCDVLPSWVSPSNAENRVRTP